LLKINRSTDLQIGKKLFPVKVDGVNRCAILDESNHLRPEITENLSKENDVHIAKLVWLSKKDNQKAYGSMVIYVTNGTQAKRLLQDQFFHVAGESGWTSIFQSFSGPTQCFNCQELGHKAFNCKKTQVCARCAKEGHSHKDCINGKYLIYHKKVVLFLIYHRFYPCHILIIWPVSQIPLFIVFILMLSLNEWFSYLQLLA
jgi:hypothetical protein